jgi:hypothetical protein
MDKTLIFTHPQLEAFLTTAATSCIDEATTRVMTQVRVPFRFLFPLTLLTGVVTGVILLGQRLYGQSKEQSQSPQSQADRNAGLVLGMGLGALIAAPLFAGSAWLVGIFHGSATAITSQRLYATQAFKSL